MGIKNSKMSVNISNPRKRDDQVSKFKSLFTAFTSHQFSVQKLEATEKGDTVEEIGGNVKVV